MWAKKRHPIPHNSSFPLIPDCRLPHLGLIVAICLFLPALCQAQQSTANADGATPSASVPLANPHSIAVDAAGNVYFGSQVDNRIFKIDSTGMLTRIAGRPGERGHTGVAADSDGNLFFVDANSIRKLASNGTITAAYSGDGDAASDAALASPAGLAVDGAGNLFIADTGNHRIRKVDVNNIVTTVAGTGSLGYSGDGDVAINAQLAYPAGIAVDREGNLFIADAGNNRIRKVGANGVMTTVAGTGAYGYFGDGGRAVDAQLRSPTAVAVDGGGNLFIADEYNHRIRKVSVDGTIGTVAGNGIAGFSGDDGPAAWAQLENPSGVAVDAAGNLYIADSNNRRIRKVTAANMILTVAGSGRSTAISSSRTVVHAGANQTGGILAPVTPDLSCIANSGVPPTIRWEGLTELASDVYLLCTGATPIAAGTIVPQMTLTIFLNTLVTNRLLSGGSEVFLAIDEPTAAQAKVCVPGVANPGAPTDPNSCPVVGTGGNVNEFKSGNANIIRGTVTANSVTFAGVPVDPPGNGSSYRVYRIINLRANASLVLLNELGAGQVTGLLTVNDSSLTVAINNPTQILGFVQGSLFADVRTADDSGPLTTPVTFQQCTPAGPTKIAILAFTEIFPSAFKTRTVSTTTPSGVTPQNILGLVYNAESGYYNPALTGSAGLAGLADFGTRFKAVFNNIPAGVVLYTGTQAFSAGGAGIGPGKGQANLTITETGAYSPASTSQVLDGIPAVALTPLNGSATAIWEMVGSNPLSYESYRFPLWIGYNGAALGTATVNSSFAPTAPSFSAAAGGVAQDATFPIPRFVATSFAASIFQISSCGSTTPVTIATTPAGGTILIDGSIFSAPQTVLWAPGSSHTITAASPGSGGAGTRFVFSSWSDGLAQSHSITVPSSAATYTATYSTQYLLTTAASPADRGSVAANPSSNDGYYNSGASVRLTAVSNAGFQFSNWSGDLSGSVNPQSAIMNGPRSVTAIFINAVVASALKFVTVPPCRFADTRNAGGPFGGPAISGGTTRDFVIPNSACGIPSTAAAYSINVTVVPHGPLGVLTVFPSGQALPLASTLNSLDARVKANAAIVPAGPNGGISVFAGDATDVILDINGYFVPASGGSTLTFFPLTPCRVADTRSSNGSLGGPFLAGGQSRSFPVRSSSCSVPATAQAYSMNYTVVPHGKLGYITTYPTGGSVPLVSTLNAIGGQVTANAAIVPGGTNGDVSVFAADDTDLVMDINGYFAPSGAGGFSLYSVAPCRVLDTRNPSGSPPFSGTRAVNVAGSPCAVPGVAQAYIFSATVVPSGQLGYLTLWPQGQAQPLVSTLNAVDGAVTSNMALVPTANGSINSFAADATHLILDVTGYFAP